ncbi:tetratricopeptide repeat protein [Desulfobulbus oligotrophicus]|uniref:Tetratricopeptide repeat protein n=1 Tax=Desulfobulbus oligotrophicus TaxID=1909699 RepID=A0A7T5VD40_9BACT|nr:tetratricopeptide repeat protein [Desulfobulbus oligotrophicus]QQG65700.1 tetratricopeptide repeat protein [Desulfobulbus oligotrophicus]
MSNEFIQPLNTIGPMKEGGEIDNLDDNPARQDYRGGRKLLTEGNYVQAALAFHNALLGFEEQGDQVGVANASDRLGDTCLARGEYAMAIANYQRTASICETQDDSFSLLAVNKKMATAYRKLGDGEKALELLYDMLEHYRLIHNPEGAVATLTLIGETYEELGELPKAADAYRSIAGIHSRFKHDRLAKEFAERADALEQDR